MKNKSIQRLTRNSIMLALMIILAYIAIPSPLGVPIVLQNFTVMLIGLLLSKWDAFGIMWTYLLLGAVGLPVFAGGAGGFAQLISISGGYLWAYPFVAFLIAWTMEFTFKKSENRVSRLIWSMILTIVFGVLLTDFGFGAAGIHFFGKIPFAGALMAQFSFILMDIIKAVVAALIYAYLPKSVTAND